MIDLDSMIQFIRDGGKFMLPIAIVGCFSWIIVFERLVFMITMSLVDRNMYNFVTNKKQFFLVKRFERSTSQSTMLHQTICAAVVVYKAGGSRNEVESAMSEGLLQYNKRIFKRTSVIGVMANVATLLGLLGTIMGLISSFASLAQADAASKGAMLSSSVSVAMNTTAFGLMVAIPLLLMGTVISSKANELNEKSEILSLAITNRLFNKQSKANYGEE